MRKNDWILTIIWCSWHEKESCLIYRGVDRRCNDG